MTPGRGPLRALRSVLVALFVGALATIGCGSEESTPSGRGGDGDVSATGGQQPMDGSGGLGSGSGGQIGGVGGMSGGGPNGTGGTMISGVAHVFVGSTDGNLRAYVMNEADGSLTAAGSTNVGSLDFFTVGPDKSHIFVSGNDSISAYVYDAVADTFTPGGSASTSGSGTHVAVDPSGGFVFLAHYSQGLLSFFTFDAGSGFSEEETFSPGQNAHQVRVDASGTHVYVPCLGSNHVAHYALDTQAGTLTAAGTSGASGGPRHMDFHPTGGSAYVLSELSSEIGLYDVESTTGALVARSGGRVFVAADEDGAWSSDIKVTPDGKHLYAVNRDPSEVVHFTIAGDQTLTRQSATALGLPVRSFAMDPKGKYLHVGGEDGVLHRFSIGSDGSLSEGEALSGLGNIRNAEIHYID